MAYNAILPDPHALAQVLLERLEGVQKAGRDAWRAQCPGHQGRPGALSVRVIDDRLAIHCFAGCDRVTILSAIDLADLFRGQPRPPLSGPPRVRMADIPVRDPAQTGKLETVWARGLEITENSPAGRYLRHRGIGIELPGGDMLRWVPDLGYFEAHQWVDDYPAIVGRLEAQGVGLVALLRIYLRPDGYGLAPVADPKKTTRTAFPSHPIRGAAVALYPGTGGRVAVAEGIVTAIACRELLGEQWAVYAAGDAGRLEEFRVPDGTQALWILGDNDANGRGQEAAEKLASRYPGIAHVRIPPVPDDWTSRSYDWLDRLRARKGLTREQ